VKADARRHWDDDGGDDRLREALSGWTVAPPPPELEDALRREFRSRRARRRPAPWLSIAAALAMLAAWPLVSARLGRKPTPTLPRLPAPVAASSLPPAPPIRPTPRPAVRRVAPPKAAEPPVVVEPAQAELLAAFARTAWERTEAEPGTSLRTMPTAEAPTYRAEWEEVAGVWPAQQVVVPKSER
jgi:hypothetical protein